MEEVPQSEPTDYLPLPLPKDPADLPEELTQKIKDRTKEIYGLLDLKGIARADYIIQEDEPYLIEVNTVPGMSGESLIPQMAEYDGISLKDLFNDVMNVAFKA